MEDVEGSPDDVHKSETDSVLATTVQSRILTVIETSKPVVSQAGLVGQSRQMTTNRESPGRKSGKSRQNHKKDKGRTSRDGRVQIGKPPPPRGLQPLRLPPLELKGSSTSSQALAMKDSFFALKFWDWSPSVKFRRVTIRGAQPSARLSKELFLADLSHRFRQFLADLSQCSADV